MQKVTPFLARYYEAAFHLVDEIDENSKRGNNKGENEEAQKTQQVVPFLAFFLASCTAGIPHENLKVGTRRKKEMRK